MALVQMNIRIDEDLKSQGDVVFARLGYSPTQVIRAVWGYAASNCNDPEAVGKILDAAMRAANPSLDEQQRRRIAAVEEGLGLFATVHGAMGVDASELPIQNSDIWIEQARYEHAVDKGWVDANAGNRSVVADDDHSRWFEIAEKMKNG